MTEIEEIEKQIKDFVTPLNLKLKELRDKEDAEYKAKKEADFKSNIGGKIFYGNKDTWSGYEDSIYLIKPDNCINWERYDSCDGWELKISYTSSILARYDKNHKHYAERKFENLSIKREQFRIDLFKTHYKELTPEMYSEICNILNNEIILGLDMFIPSINKPNII